MNKGIFITGTDTGVGKTLVSAIILSSLRNSGIDAVPMKPVQTGCTGRKNSLKAPDLDFIMKFTGINPSPGELKLMCPYKFKPACSPHLAVAMTGKTISLKKITACFTRLAASHQSVIVEGAGGVLVPIHGKVTMLDLMKSLGLPVILVARAGLGTINHTLLSIREIRRAGLTLKGVIFNQANPGRTGHIERDNLATIEKLGKVQVLGYIPFSPRLRSARNTK